jgi:biotin carboxylase
LQPIILCLASYEKGAEFLRECRNLGARVHLVTLERLKDADWPREAIDGFWRMPDEHSRADILNAVSWLARTERFDRIIALDEFDLETAAALREHLRIPGMGESETRFYRDKLAMRERARDGGVLVPPFTGIFHHDDLRTFVDTTPAPWMIKPRTEASAVGIRKISVAEEVLTVLDELGDRQSFHLLERFIAGDVYHVDSIVNDGSVVFAEAHRYASPPFHVMHRGGLFCTRTLPRGSEEDIAIRRANEALVGAMGFRRGVLHTEFIRDEEGRFWFVETAARAGGAHIVETIEAATGVNLWREWARLEVATIRGQPYTVPPSRHDYGGVLISLARQEWPDTSAYDAPEVTWRMRKRHHAGLILASHSSDRLDALLTQYMVRYQEDFYASMPAPDKPTA